MHWPDALAKRKSHRVTPTQEGQAPNKRNLIHAQRPFMMTEDLLYGHSLCGIAPQSLILLFQESKFFLFLLQAFSQ